MRTNLMYWQKLEFLSKICATDSMGLYLILLVFTQLLFSKFARSDARQTGTKTEFNTK